MPVLFKTELYCPYDGVTAGTERNHIDNSRKKTKSQCLKGLENLFFLVFCEQMKEEIYRTYLMTMPTSLEPYQNKQTFIANHFELLACNLAQED